jgi:hypothetical protein
MKPLYGFDGKLIELVRVITLPVSFGTPKNPHTEFITFDVVDMIYPYNTIFRRGLLNMFEAALHSAYLCLKIPVTFGVISVFGRQQEARNTRQATKIYTSYEKTQSITVHSPISTKQKL